MMFYVDTRKIAEMIEIFIHFRNAFDVFNSNYLLESFTESYTDISLFFPNNSRLKALVGHKNDDTMIANCQPLGHLLFNLDKISRNRD